VKNYPHGAKNSYESHIHCFQNSAITLNIHINARITNQIESNTNIKLTNPLLPADHI